MKRLALVLILVLVAWNLGRRHSHAVPPHEPRATAVMVVINQDDGPADTSGPRINGHGKRRSIVIHPRVRVPDRGRLPLTPPSPPAAPTPDAPPQAPQALSVALDPQPTPAWFLVDDRAATSPTPELRGFHPVKGRQSISRERADQDARSAFERSASEWLRPEVPRTWTPPRRLLDAMVIDRHVEPVEHDYGLTYKAAYQVNYSPEMRGQLIRAYYHEVGVHRMIMLGGGLAFALVCLAGVAGYIRADEATKGYYTNRLRILTALGVGAAGGAILHMLS